MPATSDSFAEVLKRAIERRGLGLDRIRDHLEQRGASISPATLSYWQSGRSQPSRKASLAALADLEAVLALEPGELRRTLPLTRGRSRRGDVLDLRTLWPESPQTEVLSRLDTSSDAELDRVSLHDLVRIGADRRQTGLTVRQVMRARVDGPDRRVVMHCQDDRDASLPEIRVLQGCRLGRVEHDVDHGVVGAELVFFTPLRRGETVVVEYEFACPSPGPLETGYHRRLRLPMREYLLEVEFDKAARPETVVGYGDGWESRLDLDPDNRGHLVHIDAAPGIRGIRWTWPEPATALS